jgi:hypothetical protein
MEAPSPASLILCYCYANEDHKYAQNLGAHLALLKGSKCFQACYACAFVSQSPWDQQIANHINAAHFVLLLISVHFLRADETYQHEIALAFERQRKGAAHVIPIFLKDVALEGTYLSGLHMLPNKNEWLTRVRDKDHAFAEISRKIQQMAYKMETVFARQAQEANDTPPSQVGPFAAFPVLPERHQGFLSVSWSAQAAWLAVGTTDGALSLYCVSDHGESYVLREHEQEVYGVVWFKNLLASHWPLCLTMSFSFGTPKVEKCWLLWIISEF